MTYLNWLSELYRINVKTNSMMHKTPVCDMMVDMIMEMDNTKLRYMLKLNKDMGIK